MNIKCKDTHSAILRIFELADTTKAEVSRITNKPKSSFTLWSGGKQSMKLSNLRLLCDKLGFELNITITKKTS